MTSHRPDSLPGRLIKAVTTRLRAIAAVRAARSASLRRLTAGSPRRVLVICYGNIYRSAFVGELLRNRLGPDFEIRSAGFHAREGRPSPDRHIEISKEYGVSLDRHRSRLVVPEDLQWADLIVLMDRHNWLSLSALGAGEDKLIWLGALLPGPVEISDPYTLGDDEARRIVGRMRALSEELIRKIASRG